ncbi:non-ribosomal peptide synthetase [Synechococcus sp. CBW1004]|uniref:non-ribosomal peptide synthetase n=1 Tax=Synechococcus sp. CBW1004 TaxID=1353136 RepID=UPI0018CDA653|nr:non-ribosomal peptide synthetase [Synechococcus sp. CBW1004]QPN62717.1 amino acid adenylation domain-containing protein [Synechococcus sp. CBW1004]
MNTANSLASRVARLRTLRSESTTYSIPTARPLPGEWPRGCQAFAASYAQARLWFLQQLEPGLTAYHLPLLWRLQGELDVRALEQALAALIERHPTLRTAFQLQGNEVLQIIHPPGDVTLLVEPLGDRDTDQVIEGWLEQERSTPFDLASGVLLRSRLLRVAPEKHLLLINHHHIASDGWSRSVLARDLVELYNALHSRRPPQLPPLTVHYQDFAAWQQQRLGGPRLQELKEYWISQLRELDPLVLPSDQPRPAVPSHRGGRVTFQIEAEILEPFEELCRKGGATLQMGLLAAVALLLHRYSRQNDFAIGVPIWSRNNPALESLIGFFINTLPIRTQFEAEQSFRQLLAQIKDTSLAAYDRQELPFEQIVQALMMERDTSRNPFYQVMLQLTEISYPSLENLDGLKAELITASTSSLFDLAFSFHRIARQGLRGFIIYASDLFSVDRIDRLAAHLLVLLKSIVKSPDARIASHSLLTDSEEEQIVNWSAAVSAPDGGERNSNQSIDDHDLRAGKTSSTQQSAVTKKIEDLAHLYPDNTALSDGVRRLSYKKLLELTDTLSRHIATLCTPSDHVVILLADPRLEAILCMVSCLFACKAFVVIDSRLPVNRIRNILSEIGHAPIISTKALHSSTVRKDLTERTTLYLSLSEDSELRIETETLGEAYGQTNSLVDNSLADNSLVDNSIAYIIFTSGSTGKPKGVLIDRTALDTFSNWATHEFNITSVDRVLQFSSLTFDACIEEIFPALSAGAAIVCCNEEATGSTKRFLNFLEEYKITIASLPTAFWAGLVRECAQSNFIIPHDLRLLIVGGEAMHLHHLRLWEPLQANHTRLLNTYGPTETTVEVACQDLSDSWRFQSRVPLGRPIPHARAWILEPNGLPCPIGIPGELHIGGPTLAHGYLNNPGLTADRFIPDPFSADPTARLYKSGDLASWNPDGTLAFHGRIDQQIKLRGFRIEPGEIEANLLDHPAVAQAVVVLRSDDPSNPCLVGYWVGVTGVTVSAEELRGFLAERLPDFMVPAALVELKDLPLTSNGKLDRRALPEPSFAGDLERRVEPGTELERQIHALWAEVLGHSDFGITDDFFAIGGHSLAAVRLVSRIEQALGSAPPLAALFQNPTIAGLAPLVVAPDADGVTSALQTAFPVAESLPGERPRGAEAYPASHAQARLWFLQQLEPELTAYHLPALWRLRGDLNSAALERALADLIERHPTLRTSFCLEGNEVVQLIHPPEAFALAVEFLGEREEEEVIVGWLEEEGCTPFDLTSGVLVRARLLVVGEQEHVLLVNHHHIASDGWSRSVLGRDLVELYNAHRAGRTPGLPPLRVQYQDYAAWQRQRLSGERLQKLREYWLGQLEGLAPLELPSDHSRPALPSHRGGRVSFQVGADLLAPFEELCRSEGATLQMGLLAVVTLLLHRYSRQDDVAIGVPIWGRNHPDLEPLIGFFINTLPVRTRFQAGQSFRELLAQVRDRSIGAYEHQELPFERMVEALNVERDTSRNPLVQVMFQLIELPEAALTGLTGLQVQQIGISNESSKLDLGFQLQRNSHQGISGTITFATDLFDSDRIQRLSRHLVTLLGSLVEGMGTEPDLPASRLNLLPKEEMEQLLTWSHPSDRPAAGVLVHQFAAQGSHQAPAAPAVRHQDSVLSHGDLARHVDRLARRLVEQGVRPGQRVGILLGRRPELPVAMLAVLAAGGCYVPMDPAYPDERIAMLFDNAVVELVITSPPMAERLRPSRVLLFSLNDSNDPTPGYVDPLEGKLAEITLPSISDDQPAYFIHTSGSTGRPKGVEVSHRSALQMLHCRLDQLTPPWTCRLIPFYGSIAFDASVAQIFTVLAAGGCLLMLDTISELASSPYAGMITAVSGTTTSIREMIIEGLVPRNIKVIGMGAEPIPADLCSRLQEFPELSHLFVVYGLTEAAGFSTALLLKREEIATFASRRSCIGAPIPGAAVYILDEELNLLPPGVPGEIHIGGAGVASGYVQLPKEEEGRFLPDPFGDGEGARLLRTGDVGIWTNKGKIQFLGRIDQQIKLRGHRIEPGEIESILLQHPAVGQAVVILEERDPANPRLIAYWVPDSSNGGENSATPADLRSFLMDMLPGYMVPAAFMELEDLPLTANGKLNRRALPAASVGSVSQEWIAPTTDLQRQLHAIWSEVLGHGDFGITDDFFDIGGHSLAAARLANRINQMAECQCRVSDLFSSSTIQSLADYLARAPEHGVLVI